MNYVEKFNLFGVEAMQIPCIKGDGAPTTATPGAVGCLYMNTATGKLYKCTAVSGEVYTWVELVEGAVLYTGQTLTEEQEAAARNNINAARSFNPETGEYLEGQVQALINVIENLPGEKCWSLQCTMSDDETSFTVTPKDATDAFTKESIYEAHEAGNRLSVKLYLDDSFFVLPLSYYSLEEITLINGGKSINGTAQFSVVNSGMLLQLDIDNEGTYGQVIPLISVE